MELNIHKMDKLSKGVFAPVYPIIAKMITEKTGIIKGVCIDIGAGPASLSIALAKITDLKIYAMDISNEIFKLSLENIKIEGLNDKITPIIGDVHHMPFDDEFADLIISRDSIAFWDDLSVAFHEIHRILKSDGVAYIGGGFGCHELKEDITRELKSYDDGNYCGHPDIDTLELAVQKAGIHNYILINDGSGLWILIKKNNRC